MEMAEYLFVIRSVGERTTDHLKEQLLELANTMDAEVRVVNITPFSEAIRQSFKLADESDCRILVMIDADVIVISDKFRSLVSKASQAPDVLGYQGYCHDFFWQGPRRGGVHIYNMRVIKPYIEQLDFDASVSRPETHIKKQLEELTDRPYWIVPFLCCYHAYDQDYSSWWRTLVNQAGKSPEANALILSNLDEMDIDERSRQMFHAAIATGKAKDDVRILRDMPAEEIFKSLTLPSAQDRPIPSFHLQVEYKKTSQYYKNLQWFFAPRVIDSEVVLHFLFACKNTLLMRIFDKLCSISPR